VAFRESPAPDEELRESVAFIRENTAVLKRVIELAPGSPYAARAAELLKEAQR
jgi:hypothetical protein